jgi:hypothetical protein
MQDSVAQRGSNTANGSRLCLSETHCSLLNFNTDISSARLNGSRMPPRLMAS